MAEVPAAWQDNKKVLDRNSYLLENEIATDVCFELCSTDGSTTLVRAHKLMLLGASPVFEAMFCGEMAEARRDCDNIKIPDIDAETFREMLRYIYVETARITDATALPLLYAAKKYLLTGLLQECRRASKKALTCSVDTVCAALQQSISLGEDELKEKSLKFVRENTRRVFNTEAFLHLPHNALEDVVSLDTVSETSERELFEACVKWARCQLRKLGNEHPSGEEIRNVLGDVLYKIRFPTMTQREFAGLTAHSKILSLDEKHDVYVYMTTGEKTETLKFEVQRRQQQENVISRFTRIGNEYWEYNDEMEASDAVRIQTTVDIRLTGVGLYGGTESSTHDVVLRVWKGDRFFRNGEILSTTETTITSDGSQTPVKIVLKKPVDIQANAMYTVEAVITGQRTWSGINNTSPTCHLTQSGKITFYESAMSVNGTDARRGQIPQLFYTKKQRR